MTQTEVCGDFITRNMLSKIENDSAKPSIKTIEYLARILNKPISYFMEPLIDQDYHSINKNINLKDIYDNYKSANYNECLKQINNLIYGIDIDSISNKYEIIILLRECYLYEGLGLIDSDIEKAKDNLQQSLNWGELSLIKNLDSVAKANLGLYRIAVNENNIKNTLSIEKIIHTIDKECSYTVQRKLILYRYMVDNKRYEEVIDELLVLEPDKMNSCNRQEYYYLLGEIFYDKKEYGEVIDNLLLAESCDYKGSETKMMRIYTMLSDSYSKIEDYKRAYEYSVKINKIVEHKKRRF